jgi:hypothetical protein
VRRSAILIALVLAALVAVSAPPAAQAKSKQCGTTLRAFPGAKFTFKVWVAHGNVSCTLAKKVMGRAFTTHAVKGWKCIDATKGPPVAYSDSCKKGRLEVRGDYLGKASRVTARAAFTGTCQTVALTEGIDARVVVAHDTCARGRALVRQWLKANVRDDAAPRLRRVDGYTCVFGGHTLLVLRCTQGERTMRATWGD